MFGALEFIKVCQVISNEITQMLSKNRLKGVSMDQEVGIGADGEPTYEVDAFAEKRAIDLIKQTQFRGRVITEELGLLQLGANIDTIWLDPIDGTRNTFRNIPYFALSVSLFHKNTFISGYIRNLANGDEFIAYEGCATLNGNLLKPISRPFNTIGVVVIRPRTKKGFHFLHYLQQRIKFIRMMGAAALDIAYIASGALDVFLDLDRGLKTVDYAAAQPILEQVGGVVSDLQGQPIQLQEDLTIKSQMVAASNTQIHLKLLDLLKDFGYI